MNRSRQKGGDVLKIFVVIANVVSLFYLSAIVINEGLPSSGSDKALIGCLFFIVYFFLSFVDARRDG